MESSSNLTKAQLEKAVQQGEQLKGADLEGAELKGAILRGARLEGAILSHTQLEGANLEGAQLKGADLTEAQLKGARLREAQLKEADLSFAHLEGANLSGAQLEGASLHRAQLNRASLHRAHLEGANLSFAYLEGAILYRAHLEGANLSRAQLEGADLTETTLSNKNHIGPRLADAQWGTINLAVVDWSLVTKLGDEWEAEQKKTPDGKKKEKDERLNDYRTAVRANRQLAVALQAQGLNEDAARFAYRAGVNERKVFYYQLSGGQIRQLGAYLFSWFLALLTGYGFRMKRIIVAYVLIVLAFAVAYWYLGFQALPSLNFWQAMIVSVTAFHGRVFANPFTLNEPQIAFTALEAIFGLVIEGVFIAMLVQRFFGK